MQKKPREKEIVTIPFLIQIICDPDVNDYFHIVQESITDEMKWMGL